MTRNYSNTALDTTLVSDITAGANSLTVASSSGYPAVPFAVALDPGSLTTEEVVLVTGVASLTWTVTRGYDGTVAAAHSAGVVVRHAAIAADFTDLQAAIALSLTQAAADARYAQLAVSNIFDLGQTIHGHSAIGDDATIDAPYFGDSWSQVLRLDDGIVTDMSASIYSSIGISAVFDPAAPPNSQVYLLNFEAHARGAFDYQLVDGIYGATFHDGSGTINHAIGANFGVSNTNTGTVTHADSMYADVQNYGGGLVANANPVTASIQAFSSSPIAAGTAYLARFVSEDAGSIIGTAYGLHVIDAGLDIPIGTFYGVKVDTINATTRYAWWSDTGPMHVGDYIEMPEITAPAAGGVNTARLFTRDNGAGKTQLCAVFNTGAIQVLATQP